MSTPHAATPHAAHATSGRLHVAIVTPEGAVFDGEAASLVVPGHDGEVAFFPLHASFVGALGYGELRLDAGGGTLKRWYVEGGVAEVSDDQVTVLAERVLLVEKIDTAAAQADLEKAVASVPADEPAAAARAALIRSAQARLRLAARGSAPSAH
jgi:F-type H+-transporting ATPase subunit epsilon